MGDGQDKQIKKNKTTKQTSHKPSLRKIFLLGCACFQKLPLLNLLSVLKLEGRKASSPPANCSVARETDNQNRTPGLLGVGEAETTL